MPPLKSIPKFKPLKNNKQIDINIKRARLSALQSLLKEQQSLYNKSFVNKKIEVLFERRDRYQDQFVGRSIYNQSVFINNSSNLVGLIKDVRVKRSTDFALEGTLSE